ncbi:amidase [bacterium]|nr:amidase [bacterium]NUN44720.1 amidase [bacterium]
MKPTRRIVLFISAITAVLLLGMVLQEKGKITLTKDMIAHAEKLFGLQFNEAKRDSMLESLQEQLGNYEAMRKIKLDNSVAPALQFNPIPVGFKIDQDKKSFKPARLDNVIPPPALEDLAYYSVSELAWLIKNKKVTSELLTKMFLDRLRRYGPKLENVITITEGLAIKQARKADAEIAQGKYRGPLHGIPYGVKDLLATVGYKTTWGSVPYKEQLIDEDATVVRRLEEAGAVLVAKLTMGELAWGDVWYGGKTRNPWDTTRGSSGSSAGSASAVSAGLLPFAIGTETWGSIVSPSTECGTSGLRPTYGRVSRYGAMALSWSMDKIGPIARSAEDCALIFNAMYGPDGLDKTLVDAAFNYDASLKISNLRIGYLKSDMDRDSTRKAYYDTTLAVLRKLGAKLTPIQLPQYPVYDMAIILSAEAGAAFDELTRSGKDDQLVRQIKNAWPTVFRASRFIPAVEYIQANRIRTQLIQDMQSLMDTIDVYIAPPFEGDNLILTNLTGHPCVVVPNGFTERNLPTSVCFMGKLFGEAEILALAKQYQDATDYHKRHPGLRF